MARDGLSLWIFAGAALIAYLVTAQIPPNQWSYMQWLQFGAAVCAYLAGKFQSSPLPSSGERSAGMTSSGKILALLLALGLVSAGCATTAGTRPPDVATAQVGTSILKAATALQIEVNRLTAAGTLPIAIGQQITDADKIVSLRSGQLSDALKAYHAATSLADRSAKAAEVQALITQLSEPIATMLGLKLPGGAAPSVSRLIGTIMQAVGAVQAEIAKGLSGAIWRPAPAFA